MAKLVRIKELVKTSNSRKVNKVDRSGMKVSRIDKDKRVSKIAWDRKVGKINQINKIRRARRKRNISITTNQFN